MKSKPEVVSQELFDHVARLNEVLRQDGMLADIPTIYETMSSKQQPATLITGSLKPRQIPPNSPKKTDIP